jgi:hypothetical protein
VPPRRLRERRSEPEVWPLSVWIVSKTDIDALVTVPFRWSETGVLTGLPKWVAGLLTVTPSNASDIGSRLWRANHDTFNYGGPRELLDPEMLAEVDAHDVAVTPPYEFQALPGMPRPETAIRRVGYYAYQTAGEYWGKSMWPQGKPPFEMLFHQAIVWTAAGLIGITRPEAPLTYDPDHPDAMEDQLMDDPVYKASGWGLGNSDRDLFLRVADL